MEMRRASLPCGCLSGNWIKETHANGSIIRYTYNVNDQLTTLDYGNYLSDNYSYDARGNLTSIEQKQGIVSLGTVATYAYNARNQLTQADITGTQIRFCLRPRWTAYPAKRPNGSDDQLPLG
jgi:YD repeat-containing protein